VKGCLIDYERMSGHSVNFGKSTIMFSRNTEEGIKNVVSVVFNVTHTDISGVNVAHQFSKLYIY